MIKLRYDVELSDWEVVVANTELEEVDCQYDGFTGIKYNGKEYYLHNGYFVNVLEAVTN
jgi:hypothetical protein